MRLLLLLLALVFALDTAAQEQEYETSVLAYLFRGNSIMRERKIYPDGSYIETYKDIEDNPLTETERNYIDGMIKIANSYLDLESTNKEVNRATVETDPTTNNSLLTNLALQVYYFGDIPEFRAHTGITLEQVRDTYLAMWEWEESPSDELLDIALRAVKTEDADVMKTIRGEFESYHARSADEFREVTKKIFTSDQLQKFLELHILSIPEENNTAVLAHMLMYYKALNLSEEQQKQLAAILSEYGQKLDELRKMARLEDRATTRKEHDDLVKIVQSKLTALLTDAQKAKLEQLRKNPPKFVRGAYPVPPKEEDNYDFLKSWKPGDPIPEGLLPPKPPARKFMRGM